MGRMGEVACGVVGWLGGVAVKSWLGFAFVFAGAQSFWRDAEEGAWARVAFAARY